MTTERMPQQHGPAASSTSGNGRPESRPDGLTQPPRRRLTATECRRLGLLAVLIIALGAGGGFGGALLLPEQLAARTQLRYDLAQAEPNELLREDRTLTTQLVLLRSRGVLGPVAVANGLTVEDLEEQVTAEVVDSSEIIEVEVRDRWRERGLRMLTAIIDRYLALANGEAPDPVRAYLGTRLDDTRDQLRAPGLSTEATAELTAREAALLDLLDPALLPPVVTVVPPSGAPAQVLTAPYSVAKPVSPRPLFAAATGALSGLIVAAGLIFVVSRRWLRS